MSLPSDVYLPNNFQPETRKKRTRLRELRNRDDVLLLLLLLCSHPRALLTWPFPVLPPRDGTFIHCLTADASMYYMLSKLMAYWYQSQRISLCCSWMKIGVIFWCVGWILNIERSIAAGVNIYTLETKELVFVFVGE